MFVGVKRILKIADDKDLIYEGIATGARFPFSWLGKPHDDKDLIYEGIATKVTLQFFLACSLRRQRPDLRRDCDNNHQRKLPIGR